MDVFDILLQAGLITSAVVVYLLVFRRRVPRKGSYKLPGWNYPLKLLYARYAVSRWKTKLVPSPVSEVPNINQREGVDSISLKATANDGTVLFLSIRKLCGRKSIAEVTVHVKLPDGTTYKLLQHPDTAVGTWEDIEGGWRANGLKIQILEPELRLRILYNGLLIRKDDVTQHVTMNFIWIAATPASRYPEDWSNELAAEALAIEPWRDSNWPNMLGKYKEGSRVQFGQIQGRFQSYDVEGVIDKSEYLRARGVLERSCFPHGYQPIRRSIHITTAATDGTVVALRCVSYNKVLTQCISGSVRMPNYSMESVTATDVIMSEFCELPNAIPKMYALNVSTKSRDLKVIIRINDDGGTLFSGIPYQQQVLYRTLEVDIDGYAGTGILELGYQPSVIKEPSVHLSAPASLKWLSSKEAGTVGYCLSFDDRAASCADYVGGKGASLALLASVQRDEGYSVPPGFCLTINALNKHLDMNPEIMDAIREIEAANENYDENNFKQKCEKASSLFVTTAITGEVKDSILTSLTMLRKKAADDELGDQIRFAVRSSAVGEDSEVLSAAGQNDTILGCISDDDVLQGVQKCWGSMFAFTSAYYRRQNGQPCWCGGGVVVQTLVKARVAGVMFTRHPEAGDPSRLLITANYGLGESVVSGSAEPDTFIVARSATHNTLSIARAVIGGKKQRVVAQGSMVALEDVPVGERGVACLSDADVLRLGALGVAQEELWAAPRDIEWALVASKIYLLQARPITSLERWTEEELLHELDDPIMSDDEITSFGNTGEVYPRPMSPLTNDVVKKNITEGMDEIINKSTKGFDPSVVTTHNRCALSLYNSVYRSVRKEIDINIRMIEMSIHGHKVADESILSTALHRRQPQWADTPKTMKLLLKTLLTSKCAMNSAIKLSKNMSIGDIDPSQLYEAIKSSLDMLRKISYYHCISTTACTSSQVIAMSVLLEGRSDFSPELCNEIGALLSSGDVLSAEVPHGLARLANKLHDSGKYPEFRTLSPALALPWLKDNLPDVYDDVCRFLDEHGHRAIMEFDLSTKPWVLVPEEMMKVLQNLQGSNEEKQKSKTDDEIIASLKSPQKPITRKILRWLMPLCRHKVRHREGTKAHLILAVHKLRLAFLRLGNLMVKQWYLPHQDLIFHFRFHELRDYIRTRDPALLRKAIQRQQYYPRWCKLKFAEINFGYVSPLATRGPMVTAGDVKIEAASVCGGEVVARACVVKDLSEIDQLQQGDILITHSTDIGWSPYFPLLTGIVTELGGLISHGAVIAREYGLPCIVGAADATDIFKTGDIVRLSGTKGTLEKVQVTDDAQLN